jgi:lipopolysaccharide/colanic/teichoic acid biosynthesis glycosyltransferase
MPLWKRIADIGLSLAAMPLLAACMVLVAIVHEIVSPGPLFFVQERVGHLGRRFRIFKFRTMTVNADTAIHQAYFSQLISSNATMVKLDSRGDSRVIRGGWLLRASGLDELPQLINVLLGDMSVVGPRPCLPSEYAEYLPAQRLRFNATPGLTGLWQVSGKNRTTFEEMIRLDIEYARIRSPWLDAMIIIRTVPAALMQIGDARSARVLANRPQGALARLQPETTSLKQTVSPS